MSRLSVFAARALLAAQPALAQRGDPAPYPPTPEERRELDEKRQALIERLKALEGKDAADVVVFLNTAVMADRQAPLHWTLDIGHSRMAGGIFGVTLTTASFAWP